MIASATSNTFSSVPSYLKALTAHRMNRALSWAYPCLGLIWSMLAAKNLGPFPRAPIRKGRPLSAQRPVHTDLAHSSVNVKGSFFSDARRRDFRASHGIGHLFVECVRDFLRAVCASARLFYFCNFHRSRILLAAPHIFSFYFLQNFSCCFGSVRKIYRIARPRIFSSSIFAENHGVKILFYIPGRLIQPFQQYKLPKTTRQGA